jgi:hypothetical protein
VHAAQFGLLLGREFRFSAFEVAFRASNGHSFAGACAQQVDFEFGEGGEDAEEHLSIVSVGS